jgi:hypothetical protein
MYGICMYRVLDVLRKSRNLYTTELNKDSTFYDHTTFCWVITATIDIQISGILSHGWVCNKYTQIIYIVNEQVYPFGWYLQPKTR